MTTVEGRPLRIALVSRYYPPDPGGGLALYTRQIAIMFARMGHEVIVVTSRGWYAEDSPAMEETENLRVLRLPQHKVYQRSLTGMTGLVNSVRIAMTLEALHEEKPLDVVHCPASFYESLVFGMTGKKRFRIPLVVKFHENAETFTQLGGRLQHLKSARRRWFRNLTRWACLDADYWLGVSEHSLQSTLSYLKLTGVDTPRSASPSPIDVGLFCPTPAPLGYLERFDLSAETPFILYSGRLVAEKGLPILMDAFLSRLCREFPDLHLAIAGEHDFRQPQLLNRMKVLMKGHSAAGRVRFLGRIPYADMPWWYSACRVFVAPSHCEPFGRVFIEAMACGAPVVGFNRGGGREIVTTGVDGLLVEEMTPQALAGSISVLLNAPEISFAMGQQGRRTVVENYSQEKVARELIQIYQQVSHHLKRRPAEPHVSYQQ